MKQVTAEEVAGWTTEWSAIYKWVPFANQELVLDRVKSASAFAADKINALLAERDAEIARLRDALEMFAAPENWQWHEEYSPSDWIGEPMPWIDAQAALKGGPQ